MRDNNLLRDAQAAVDSAIDTITGRDKTRGAFICSSTRSPKDSICSREKCKQVLLEELAKGDSSDNVEGRRSPEQQDDCAAEGIVTRIACQFRKRGARLAHHFSQDSPLVFLLSIRRSTTSLSYQEDLCNEIEKPHIRHAQPRTLRHTNV